jgi:hypothetical protein
VLDLHGKRAHPLVGATRKVQALWRKAELFGSLLNPADSDTGDTMMLSLYVALGIFLLIAVRNPSAHRSLIAFAAWSSFAHAVAMSILGLEIATQRIGFLVASAVLVVIGVALIVLAPAKQSVERLLAPAT